MQRLPRYFQQRRPWLAAAALATTTTTVSVTAIFCGSEEEENEDIEKSKARQQQGFFFPLQSYSCQCQEQQQQQQQQEKDQRTRTRRTVPATTSKLSQPNMNGAKPPKPKAVDTKTKVQLKKFQTIRRMDLTSTKVPLESKYIWHKNQVLGEGAYGSVFRATSKATTEDVALKQIPKKYTNSVNFQQEMRAMLYIRSKGGHPHLCSLHEHFDSSDNYYVILDYIGGGEMFDHLIRNGAYSELDASRLVREVASALNFLHGIGVVHADLKPENILLTTSRRGDAVVKLADFGCSQIIKVPRLKKIDKEYNKYVDDDQEEAAYGAPTPAYCPPESIWKTHPIQPAADMWGLGIILFIMLTGAHPYDLSGEATDDEIEERIKDPKYRIPINNQKVTGHLSASAKDLIRSLMERDPTKRLTAFQMLQHPWIRGESATTTIMVGSDAKLSKFRRLQSKLQAKFFETAIHWSDQVDDGDVRRKTSMIERSFKALDAEKQGYLTTQQILGDDYDEEEGGPAINMSDFTNLLSDNIIHQHFPAGQVVYQEGDTGNHMYFIDSGTVSVTTADGSRALRSQGDFFGEGALLHPKRIRSATVTCTTPIHALEISREYFEKYIASNENALLLTLKEKDKIRKRNRAKNILRLQKNLKTVERTKDGTFFKEKEVGDCMFILEKGKVDMLVEGNHVFSAFPGNTFGEHSVLTGKVRNCTAKCVAPEGCVAQELLGPNFRKLVVSSPNLEASLRDLHLRREFKKAVVLKLKKEFPYEHPEEAFQAADEKALGLLDKESIAKLMRELNPDYTDEEIDEVIATLNLTSINKGTVTFDEFQKVFIGDIRTSASM